MIDVTAVPRDEIPAVLCALSARLLAEPAPVPATTTAPADNWLSVEQAGAQIGRSPRWFYRNAKRLPFVKRLSRKVLLVSEQGMKRWIDSRQA